MQTWHWVLGSFGYLATGWWLGKKSFAVWSSKKRSLAAWLLFPISTHSRTLGESYSGTGTFLSGFLEGLNNNGNDREFGYSFYRAIMMLVWPLKPFFNLVTTLIVLSFSGLAEGLKLVFKLPEPAKKEVDKPTEEELGQIAAQIPMTEEALFEEKLRQAEERGGCHGSREEISKIS